MPAQPRQVGPDNGSLILRTSRQGLAASIGHDLTIEVTRWSGELVLAEDPERSTVSITADTGSLRVVEGSGGALPLSERDKREIARNARGALDSDRRPDAVFTSTSVSGDDQGGTVEGTLTLLGVSRPLRLTVTRTPDGGYQARGTVVQTEYGIKPYSAFFGALRLADPVRVEATVTAARPG